MSTAGFPGILAGGLTTSHQSIGSAGRLAAGNAEVCGVGGLTSFHFNIGAIQKAISYAFATSAGAYSLSGIAQGLSFGHAVVPAAGAYALTGIAQTLEYGHHIIPLAGAYAVTGVAQALVTAHRLFPIAGSYSLTGIAQELKYDHPKVLNAVSGAYSLTGEPILCHVIRGRIRITGFLIDPAGAKIKGVIK